jgi:hypothetical protein
MAKAKKQKPFATKARKQSLRRMMIRSNERITITEEQKYVAYRGKVLPAGPFECAVYDQESGVLALMILPGRYRNFRALMKATNKRWRRDGFRLKVNEDRSLEAEYIGKETRLVTPDQDQDQAD